MQPAAAVAWLPSACMVARTGALADRIDGFDGFDGFDGTLRVGEDVDLVWRLVAAGHRVRYDPDVDAAHDARPTMRGWVGRKFVYGTGGAVLASRHGGKVAPAILTPSYAVAGAALATPVARRLARILPPADAARIATRELGWAVRQESALLLRHWWLLTAVGLLRSRTVRRAAISALLIDLAVGLAQHRDDGLDLSTLVAGRRLDDLAYGSGFWWGALRSRSLRVLKPQSTVTNSSWTDEPARAASLPRPPFNRTSRLVAVGGGLLALALVPVSPTGVPILAASTVTFIGMVRRSS